MFSHLQWNSGLELQNILNCRLCEREQEPTARPSKHSHEAKIELSFFLFDHP